MSAAANVGSLVDSAGVEGRLPSRSLTSSKGDLVGSLAEIIDYLQSDHRCP